jgi:hypothetical protein
MGDFIIKTAASGSRWYPSSKAAISIPVNQGIYRLPFMGGPFLTDLPILHKNAVHRNAYPG